MIEQAFGSETGCDKGVAKSVRTLQTPSLLRPAGAICGTGAFCSIRFCAFSRSVPCCFDSGVGILVGDNLEFVAKRTK